MKNKNIKLIVAIFGLFVGLVIRNFVHLNLVCAMYHGEQLKTQYEISKWENIREKYANKLGKHYRFLNMELLDEFSKFDSELNVDKLKTAWFHVLKFVELTPDIYEVFNEILYSGPDRILDYLKENGVQLDNLKKNELKELELKKVIHLLKERFLQEQKASVNKFFLSKKIQNSLKSWVAESKYVFKYVEECCDLLKRIKEYSQSKGFQDSLLFEPIKQDFKKIIEKLLCYCFDNSGDFLWGLFNRFNRKKGFCNLVYSGKCFGGCDVAVDKFYLEELRNNFYRVNEKCRKLGFDILCFRGFDDRCARFFKYRVHEDVCRGFKHISKEVVDYSNWVCYVEQKYSYMIYRLKNEEKKYSTKKQVNRENIEILRNLKNLLENRRKYLLEFVRKDAVKHKIINNSKKYVFNLESTTCNSTYLDDSYLNPDGTLKKVDLD